VSIESIEAGEELDKLIAERVFGLTVERRGEFYRYYNEALREEFGGRWTSPVLHYSTDIADAWAIVEKLKAVSVSKRFDGTWQCWHWDKVHHVGRGPTAPLAICRAALAALEIVQEEETK
jgi:Phage ABA sandwich domain